MTINLADNDPRDSYTVANGNSQTVFTMSFEIFDDEDLNVYVDGTLKTLTSHYKISDSASDANAGHTSGTTGHVHFTSAVTASGSNKIVVLTRDIKHKRTTDFPASGAFQINSLNAELDKLIAIAADLNDEIGRSLRLTDYDTSVSLVLPDVNSRKGTVLAFDSSTGAVVAGPATSGVNTLSSIATDIATLADIQDGTVATNAISGLASISSNVTTVANISANVTTVAGNTSNIATVVSNITSIQNASANATLAQNWAIKVNGEAATGQGYSSKAWATGGTGVTDSSGAGSAKEWATDTTNTCDGTEFSAKEYAIGSQTGNTNGSAKQWALGGGGSYSSNTAVSGSLYSAKYWAEQAAASASDFNNKYHGPQSSDPTADPDSSALEAGDLYFSTTSNILRVYDGSAWNDAVVSTTGFASAGFSIAMSIAL